MCNYLRHKHTTIPESDTGYKIFIKRDNKLTSLCTDSPYLITDGKVVWNYSTFIGTGTPNNTGFCFFKTKKEAKRALNAWIRVVSPYEPYQGTYVIVKIMYHNGLGQHNEENMIRGDSILTAICQQFEIHPNESNKLHF